MSVLYSPASAILEALSRLSVAYKDSSLIATNTGGRKMSTANSGGGGSVDGGDSTEVTTEPSKWPGVTSLRALLDRYPFFTSPLR